MRRTDTGTLQAFKPSRVLVVVVVLLGLVSCGGSDSLKGLEERNPVISDLQIDGAERTSRTTSDGKDTLLGKSTTTAVRQRYEPNRDDVAVEDVVERLLAVARNEGWNMAERETGGTEVYWEGKIDGSADGLSILVQSSKRSSVSMILRPYSGEG
jgi:hypothetical protein